MSQNKLVVTETRINVLGEGSRIEGKVAFDEITRVHGVIIGDIEAKAGSTLILGETSQVEGSVRADTLLIDGFVRGEIVAQTRVVISRTGRVVGNVTTPSLKLEFGSYFEGRCRMEQLESDLRVPAHGVAGSSGEVSTGPPVR